GDLDALARGGTGQIVGRGLEVRQRLQDDLVLQPRVEISRVENNAAAPERLLEARIPADRAFRDETGIRLEATDHESELLDEARVGDAAPDARMQARAGHAELLRERIAPGVFILERLVEILPLRDRDRGAGAQQVEEVFAADTVGGARVPAAGGVEGRPEQEEAVEGEVLAPVFHKAGDAVLLAAGNVAVEQEAALVGQRLRGAER